MPFLITIPMMTALEVVSQQNESRLTPETKKAKKRLDQVVTPELQQAVTTPMV